MSREVLNDSNERPTFYRIVDWNELYERAQSRKPVILYWVPMAIRTLEDAYTELRLGHPNGTAHWGVFHDLLYLAAGCKPRGDLIRANGKPHTVETINRMGAPIPTIIEALSRLLEIGWIIEVPLPIQKAAADSQPAVNPHHPNGAETGFAAWWSEWIRVTNRNVNQAEAKKQWEKHVPKADPAAVAACFSNYSRSGQLSRHIPTNPDNWIKKCAASEWKMEWASVADETTASKKGKKEEYICPTCGPSRFTKSSPRVCVQCNESPEAAAHRVLKEGENAKQRKPH